MTHYLIDGYNWLFRSTRGRNEERLQIERERLCHELSIRLSIAGMQATIVFDSHFQPGPGEKQHLKGILIYFTDKGQTADDYILDLIKYSSKPRDYTVITSDLRLAWAVRQKSGQTLDIPAFQKVLDRIYLKKSRKNIHKAPSIASKIIPKMSLQDYYEQAFEKRFTENAQKNPSDKKVNVSKKKEISDNERWKRAFEDGA